MIKKDELIAGGKSPGKVKTKIGNDTGNDLLSCFLLFVPRKIRFPLFLIENPYNFSKDL